MPGPSAGNAGDIPLVKVGHTVGRDHGTDPLQKIPGGGSPPSPIIFDGSGGKKS